jgi:hypothetical protein
MEISISVEPDDPLFAFVTINRIVMEEATQELQDRILPEHGGENFHTRWRQQGCEKCN